jgi:hypothetical protein
MRFPFPSPHWRLGAGSAAGSGGTSEKGLMRVLKLVLKRT